VQFKPTFSNYILFQTVLLVAVYRTQKKRLYIFFGILGWNAPRKLIRKLLFFNIQSTTQIDAQLLKSMIDKCLLWLNNWRLKLRINCGLT